MTGSERENVASGADLAALYGRRLLRAALILCRDEAEAQDLAQEALCQALASIAHFRGESSPYTWLYAIMRNLYFRQQRRYGLWRSLLEKAGVGFDPLMSPEPEREYDRGAAIERLECAIARLPVKHREILLLRYVEGLKIHEIASLLALARGTVKSRLHHATRRLQREFVPSIESLPLLAEE